MIQLEKSINMAFNGHQPQQNKSNGKVYISKSAPLVEKMRQRFFDEEWPQNSELYCEQDIERVRKSEWFVKRFLLAAHRNVDEAYVMLRTALQWRRKYNLPNIRANYFPKEFYEIGGLFAYEPDRQGNPVIYLRIRMHKKIKEIHEPIQHFLFYTINCADQESASNSCVVVFDCNGASYSNMDLELLKCLIDAVFKYFPFCIRYVIVYELSWMLNALRKIAMTFVPTSFASIVRFASKNDITNYIAQENLPDFMGGTCKRDYRKIPEGCRTVLELAHEHGFTLEEAKRIMAQFEPFLKEGREAIEARKIKMIEYSIVENGYNNNNYDNEEDEKDPEQNIKHLGDDSLIEKTATTSKAHAVIHSPASKSFTHIATIYPQNVIHFKHILNLDSDPEKENFNMTATATIMVRNNHQSRLLAFKIQSNCSDQYSVTPNQGVLLPGAFISIRIITTTGKNPDLINKVNEIQDKFLILMSSVVFDSQMHLKNPIEFNKFFEKSINQVFVHKLTVQFEKFRSLTSLTSKEVIKKIRSNDKQTNQIEMLINEVKMLKKKCHSVEKRQSLLKMLLILIFISVIFIICLITLTSCIGTSNALINFITNLNHPL